MRPGRQTAQREISERPAQRLSTCGPHLCSQSARMPRLCPLLGLVFLVVTTALVGAAERNLTRFDRAEIAAAKTSIYIGSVTMTTPPFVRTAGVYEADYTAKVFPFLFSSEAGRLRINVSNDALHQLEAGEAIEFTGLAIRADGLERRVEGKATPVDPHSGRIKVRVFVSKRIELIFNTTYRFPGVAAQPLANARP